MTIPKEAFDKWKKLRSHGDNKKIAEANPGISQVAISRAFNTKECSDEVFGAIASFYKEKEEKISKQLS